MTPSDAALLPLVETPSTSPTSRVISWANIKQALNSTFTSFQVANARFSHKTIRTVAPNTMNADYLTDGSGDQVEVQQAVDAVSANGGGAVFVMNRLTGSYNVAASIETKDNVDIISNGAIFTSSMD